MENYELIIDIWEGTKKIGRSIMTAQASTPFMAVIECEDIINSAYDSSIYARTIKVNRISDEEYSI